jgi:DegV family protein with EDD domain
MVVEAARMAENGSDADTILARLAALRDTSRIYFLVDTLDYLVKGGRIGRASHLIGTLLDIKPLLTIRDGVVEDCGRYRTHHKAVAALTERVIEEVRGRGGLHLGVLYSVNKAEADQIGEKLCDTLQPVEFLMSQIGPSIGVHAGPGVLGVCYYVSD